MGVREVLTGCFVWDFSGGVVCWSADGVSLTGLLWDDKDSSASG